MNYTKTKSQKFNLKRYRKLFPVTKDYIYLNHASTGPLPIPAVKAITQLAQRYAKEGSIEWEEYEKLSNRTRQLTAKMLNVTGDEICFIQNTSQGIIIAIGTIPWQDGDNLILMQDGFPTNLYPFLYLLPNIEKRYVTSSEILADPCSITKRIDKKTKAIALDWVNFLNGIKIDLTTIGQIAKEKGIYLIIDGMQGLGATTIDLKKSYVDFFCAAAPKWLLGPHGIGILYISKKTLSHLQPFNLGWLSADWKDFYDIFTPKPLKTTAARFEPGTKNYFGIVGLQKCLRLFLEIGIDKVESQIYHLTDYLISEISSSKFETITPRARSKRAGIVSFRRKDKAGQELYLKLKQNRVVVSLRQEYLRISPHFYNTIEEIEHLIKIIKD